jgi:hypothetical protein
LLIFFKLILLILLLLLDLGFWVLTGQICYSAIDRIGK